MIEKLFAAMIKYYSGDPHQIQHFTKVHSFARLIGKCEKIDEDTLYILEIAAVLHDIGIKPSIEKYGSYEGQYQEVEGPPVAEAMLTGFECPQHIIERVCYLIGHHHTYENIEGIDYQILIEADYLVNMFECEMSESSIRATLDSLFQTKTGKDYCMTMFNIS